ncbi:MAG: serine/threonine-protein kinase [Gemmataceae bacterium]
MESCPTQELLARLLVDDLPPAESSGLMFHVEFCTTCQQTLERLTSDPLIRPLATNSGLANPGSSEETCATVAYSESSRSAAGRSREEVPGYVLLDCLGRGGMGVVYKARHLRLDRIVAVKMIRSGNLASAGELSRFRTEALAAARLQHPSIVRIYEVGEAGGEPYLCMEYVEGESLDRLINGVPWPALQAARLVESLALAMDAAHLQGIIHRDLKPANILLARSPQDAAPKITDFGLAKILQCDQGQTESGLFLGTPSYAAPEQARAQKLPIGPHTDIYSLGAILYEILTGRPPFRGASVLETIHQMLHQDPVPPRMLNPAVPQDLEAICLKCLEKSPARRYCTARSLAEDLSRWQRHEPTQARSPGPLGRAIRWCQRHPALTAIAVVIVLALLLVSQQWRVAVKASELADRKRQEAEAATLLARNAEKEADQVRKNAVEDAAAAHAVADFLGGLFEQADPFVLTGRILGDQANTNPTALDIVNRGARRLANPDLLKEKPLIRAALLDKVGHVYLSLGEGARATPFVTEALHLRRKHLPSDHADLASSLHNAGFMQLTRGHFTTSKELFTEALAMRTRLFGARSSQAMTSKFHLAFVHTMLPGISPEPMLREVLAFQREQLREAEIQASDQVGKEALECTVTLIALCNYYSINDRFLESLPFALEAIEMVQKVANKELAALCHHIVAFRRYEALGQMTRAEQTLYKALGLLEQRVGKRHYLYIALQRELAYLHLRRHRYEEAEKAFLELEENFRTTIGGDSQRLAEMSYDTAVAIWRGSFAQAERTGDPSQRTKQAAQMERFARAAYENGKQSGLEEHRLAHFATFLAEFYLLVRPQPDCAAGEEFAREAVRLRNKLYGVGHELTNHPRQYLLLALLRQGKIDEIEKLLSVALAQEPRMRLGLNLTNAFPDAARALARAGKNKTALLVLEQAVRAGHLVQDEIHSDPAFASLRGLESFQRVFIRPPVSDPDRAAAEWVLSLGGKVDLHGVDRQISSVADLPKGQLILNEVWLEEKGAFDNGMKCFNNLKGLKTLFLKRTMVTDAGLAHLKGCKALTHLSVGYTKVTDAGLVYLKDLPALTNLGIDGTLVTESGLEQLREFQDLRDIWLCDLPLTDAGLAKLKDLKKLRFLNVRNTRVTMKGLADFHATMPNCTIDHDEGRIGPKK